MNVGGYRIIVSENDRELAKSVRMANCLGDVAVGPFIVDQGRVLQVVRHVRDGYVTSDGKPCDGRDYLPWLAGQPWRGEEDSDAKT